MKNPGYHLKNIKKGQLGEFSKIKEEYHEAIDALEQNNPVMLLVELSDLVGAIELFTLNKFNITLDELIVMKKATQRAFKNKRR